MLWSGILTFVGYLIPKPFSQKNSNRYYLTHSWEDKGVHTFPKGICPKVNVIARLQCELAYYDSAVHRFNQYTTRTHPPERFRRFEIKKLYSLFNFILTSLYSIFLPYSLLTLLFINLFLLSLTLSLWRFVLLEDGILVAEPSVITRPVTLHFGPYWDGWPVGKA